MVLFVGTKRLCQQLAYVLDIPDYTLAEKLTKRNFDQYCDHQIYVCAFKRKSRKLVKVGKKVAQLNLQYLDDICRQIDEAYYANRKRQAKDWQDSKTKKNQPTHKSLGHLIKRGMKHPLRAAKYVFLVLKLRLKMPISKNVNQRRYQKKSRENLAYLHRLKPSELLQYVLQAPVNEKVHCRHLETKVRIELNHEVKGCCSAIVPFGDLLRDGELDEIYNSTYARIVKLSSLNRSYCLCNFDGTCKGYCTKEKSLPAEQWQTPNLPKQVFLSFDHSCNLCCKACRVKPYLLDEAGRQRATLTVEKLLRSGWLEKVNGLCMAGAGEVFHSPYYRQLLTTDSQRQQIEIISNGTLFNETNWNLLAGKYKTISTIISVDAATVETYQKLRGADFNQLMKNLTMLGDLHRQNKIRKFGLNFVVQRDNFREMSAFVRLGQTLGVNRINFQRLINLGTFTGQEYLKNSLIVKNKYLDYELWCVLQDPIFKDPIVDLKGLQRYIDASERRYRRRYKLEQKQGHSV